MKKSLKWLIAVVATPVILFLLLIALLYCPPVQNWAVKRVAAYVSDRTGMDVSIDHVTLSFPLDLQMDGLKVLRQNDSIANQKDTVADVHRLVASVQLLPLLKSRVEVNELTFTQLKTNTVNFIGDLRIRGNLQRLHVVSHAVNLATDSIRVNKADVEGDGLTSHWAILSRRIRIRNVLFGTLILTGQPLSRLISVCICPVIR